MDYEEQTRIMGEELKKVYHDQVTVKYVDVDKEGTENYPIINRVISMGYSYPITLINGQPRFAGAVMKSETQEIIDDLLKDAQSAN